MLKKIWRQLKRLCLRHIRKSRMDDKNRVDDLEDDAPLYKIIAVITLVLVLGFVLFELLA